jgi:hypothetical protein
MDKATDFQCGPFPRPWRVAVNPFGPPGDETDNIFVVCADGYPVFIVSKHPVWNHMEKGRLAIAEEVVRVVNKQG